MPNRVGQQLGNYRLVRLLGQGAFAEVYLGEHIHLKSYAALKVLLTFLQGKEEERFLSEAQTLARLSHPNIVRVLDYAVDFGTPVLVMDYAPNGTLRQPHPRGSCLSLETTVAYVKQVAAALQYAHNHHVIHRDVKPENILLGAKQNLLLGDFGISVVAPSPEQLSSQEMAGTIPYMAPEQLRGRPCLASDQYALGILTYEWLCGIRPFEGSYWKISEQHLSASPPPLREKDPSLPQAVEDVVLKALAKDPQQRYVSVQLFAQAFERASQESERANRYTEVKTVSLDPLSSPSRMTSRRVFLSAAQEDEAFVARLTADLELRDITVENEELASDLSMSSQGEAVRRAMRASQAVVLVASPHAYSSRAVKDHLRVADMYKRRVVAVWVAGEDGRQTFPQLEETTTMIDARNGRYQQALDEMVTWLERERSVSSSVEPFPAEPGFEPRNPYKGLRAFRPEDAEDFFGRGTLIQELLKQVKEVTTPQQSHFPTERLLTVIGPSGSGKSSVVMAGLLPRLQKGALPGSEAWVYLKPMVPGTAPLEALALTLAAHLPEKDVQSIREDLRDDSARGLHLLATHLVKEPQQRVVLLIDQFEELFHLTSSEEERQRFIELLLTAMREPQGPVLVILTLRADFYDRPLSYPELGQLILKHQAVVLPMGMQELRATITQPAGLPDVQLSFEGSLVGDLLFEVQGQIGALPLLQFTLEQLFERRKGHLLTLQAYSEIGGVKGALAKQAEDTYKALPSEEHRQLARALFLRLIDPGRTEQDTTRRRAALAEFSLSTSKETEMAQQITAAFLAARLLTTDESTGTPTIEVSHEALIREWPRLADWLHAAREDIPLQQTISKDVTEWEQHGKPKERLYRGSQLKEAQAWAGRNTSSSSEAAFLQVSAAHQRRTRVGIAAILLLLLLFIGLLVQPFVLLGIAEMRFTLAPTIVTSLSDTGPGSLRQAIALAPSGSTITFAASARGTLVLANALDITKSLTIHGPGAQVLSISSGNNIYRVNVHAGASVTISGLTFQNSTDSSIFNEGTLTLINSVVSHNRSISGAGGGIDNHRGRLTLINSVISHNTASGLYSSGGGIFNDAGTLMLVNSVITNNQSSGDLPGADGGGIYNGGTLTLTNSTVSGNTTSSKSGSDRGGGIANFGTLTLTNSTVSGNKASWEGGGIVTYSDSTLTLTNSTVSGNIVSSNIYYADGGGLANGPNTRITLINSTVSGNTSSGEGGGISNWGNQVDIEFCTIYGNKTSDKGGGLSIGDGQDNTGKTVPSKVSIRNSIITGNRAGTGPNISGPLISGGYNLVQDISGATFAANGQQSTDRVVKDLTQVFGANATLQDNGGPTQTLALLLGSPAIDAIPGSACRITITDLSGHTETITTDQRGDRRPDGSEEMCDIGAYESSY